MSLLRNKVIYEANTGIGFQNTKVFLWPVKDQKRCLIKVHKG
jgi:hypothetical protein